jgi:DNA modification methylase
VTLGTYCLSCRIIVFRQLSQARRIIDGLRDYQLEPLIWDSDPQCEHVWGDEQPEFHKGQVPQNKWKHVDAVAKGGNAKSGQFCVKCGAFFGHLGLEPDPCLYIDHLVQIFREVWRAMRNDGVIWVNISDSYNGSGGAGGEWWRDTVIWQKPNVLPASVKDRTTCDFEYVFMFAKNGVKPTFWTHRDGHGTRTPPKPDYKWFDNEEGIELDLEPENWRMEMYMPMVKQEMLGTVEWVESGIPEKRYKRYNLWKGHAYYYDQNAIREPYTEPLNRWGGDSIKEETPKHSKYLDMQNVGTSSAMRAGRAIRPDPTGRNRRSTWEVCTVPYPGAHFAVMPTKLAETPILATSSDMACPHCGAAWWPVVDKRTNWAERKAAGAISGNREAQNVDQNALYGANMPKRLGESNVTIIGCQPTCDCEDNDGSGASIVLDPFSGAATTAVVAKRLRRHYLGMEMNPDYVEMGNKRLEETAVDTQGSLF